MADVLVLENVYKSFGKRMVIDNVSLSVKEGRCSAFGPNGAERPPQ